MGFFHALFPGYCELEYDQSTEIKRAIMVLQSGKSAGPDVFTVESFASLLSPFLRDMYYVVYYNMKL